MSVMRFNDLALAAANYVASFVAGAIEGVAGAYGSFFKSSASDYVTIETADSATSLAHSDGSLVSGIYIRGAFNPIGGDEFETMASAFIRATESFLANPGHSIDIVPMRDYSGVKERLLDQLAGSRATAKRLQLDLDDLVVSKAEKLSTMCATEDIYLALWTTEEVMGPTERANAKSEAKKQATTLPKAGSAAQRQDIVAMNVRQRHEAYVTSVMADLKNAGIHCDLMSAHSMAHAARSCIDPEFTGPDTLPSLPGDPIPRILRGGHTQRGLSYADLQYPPLTWYLFPRDIEKIESRFAKIGGRVYAPIYVDIPPSKLIPFRALFAKLHGAKIPWRSSFKIDGGEMKIMGLKSVFASIAAAGSTNNQLLRDGCDQMAAVARQGGTSVRLRISFTTWADDGDVRLARDRASKLAKIISAWGKADVKEVPGDPVAGLISTIPFIALHSTATTACGPLVDIARLLPIYRSASPWPSGSMLYRTADGKVMPFDPGPESGMQNTWIYYLFAPPGYGKSAQMLGILLGAILSPGLKRLPRIAYTDIGPTSEGLIELIRDSLPDHLKHQAGYFKLKMDREYAINIFDTPLGCRMPLPEHLTTITNIITRVVTPSEVDAPYDSISSMTRKIVESLYVKYSDGPRSTPKRYSVGKEPIVDKLLEQYAYPVSRDTTWWEITDFLSLKHGRNHEATLAQRHAVPLLSEAQGVARETQIADLYGGVTISSGESLNVAFSRLISDAVRDFPLMAYPTKFDLGDIRIAAINIEDVAKKGDKAADRQTAIMYLLARYVLTKDFRMDHDSVKLMPEPYRDYHAKRIAEIFEDPKWIVCDEFHRTSDSPSVVDDVLVDIREGRKWKMSVMLASQSAADFPERFKEFATAVFMLNAGTDENANRLQDLFGFSDAAKQLLVKQCNGPTADGAPFVACMKTKLGAYTQLLYSTISPIEYWSLTTTSHDVVVRRKLRSALGSLSMARKTLASTFPGGVTDEVKRIKENMDHFDSSDPYDLLAERLIKEARSQAPLH